jgi:hypothetical protein
MPIDASKFTIASNGDIRQAAAFVPGTDARYTTLELHAWLQDLADDSAPSGDDLVSILGLNPSELAGKRNVSRPMALSLLNGVNIDDATSQWFKFGSVEQGAGNRLYTGLKVLGALVASSPIYILQNGSKITKYWQDADASNFQILVKAKTGANVYNILGLGGKMPCVGEMEIGAATPLVPEQNDSTVASFVRNLTLSLVVNIETPFA